MTSARIDATIDAVRAACIVTLLLCTAVVHADEHKKAARQLYERANSEYNLQNWEAALHDFQDVYRQINDPVILFNIGQCQRQLGDYSAAARSYRLYLSTASNVANEEQVRRLITQMEDAQKAKDSPPLTASPPVAQPIPPPSATVVTQPAPPRRAWYKDPAGLTLTVGGAAVLITGGALLGVATAEGKSADSATTQTAFDDHHNADVRYQKVGWPLLGVGIGAMAAGAIVLGVKGARARR